MSELLRYSALLVLLIGFELIYFKIAIRFQIIDKPNERSSHHSPTIRGAGIIFLFTVLIWFLVEQTMPWFMLGTVLLAIISFMDDLRTVSSALRLVVHIVAMALLFYQLALFSLWTISVVLIVMVVAVASGWCIASGRSPADARRI